MSTSSPSPLQLGLLSEQIFELLRDQILGGELTPGAHIVESELARQWGVSQAPVRDGLRKLVETGLAHHIPRRGVFVESVDANAAADAYRIRLALEPLAVRGILERGDGTIIQSLRDELDGMLEAADGNDRASLLSHDIAFHRVIWCCSGNELLPRIWPMVEKIWPLLETSVRSTADIGKPLFFESLRDVALTHEPLVSALEHGSPDAPELFASHISHIWSKIEGLADEDHPGTRG